MSMSYMTPKQEAYIASPQKKSSLKKPQKHLKAMSRASALGRNGRLNLFQPIKGNIMTSGVLSSNFSSLSPSKTPESKSTWNGRIVKTDDLPPVSHGAGGTTSLVCLCAVTTIIFALGIALTLTGYLTSIIEL